MHHHILRTVGTVIVMAIVWAQSALADPLPAPAELKARIGSAPATVEVHEPHLSTEKAPVKRRYSGYRFEVVAELLFGPMWRDGTQAIEFRALDGYVSRIPVADFDEHKAHLVVGVSDGSAFTVNNLLQNEKNIQLGPYYLIWENIEDAAMFNRGASGWPYQVAEILRVNISDERLRPAGLDPALDPAIDLVRTHCLTCHKLNGIGGDKVPGDLAGLARSLDDAGFRAWVLDPRSIQPTSTMPALSRGLPDDERERIARLLRAYLLAMPGDG